MLDLLSHPLYCAHLLIFAISSHGNSCNSITTHILLAMLGGTDLLCLLDLSFCSVDLHVVHDGLPVFAVAEVEDKLLLFRMKSRDRINQE